MIWQARHRIAVAGIENSWWGLAGNAAGLLLYVIGEFATCMSCNMSRSGWSLWGVGIALLEFVGRSDCLSSPYLLTTSRCRFLYASYRVNFNCGLALGVGCLQLVGVTAFREGNVIDLGPIQLQVVEACSGIRYLLPLTSLRYSAPSLQVIGCGSEW